MIDASLRMTPPSHDGNAADRSRQRLRKAEFYECIRPAKDRCQPGLPILPVNGLPRVSVFLRRQQTRRRSDLRPSNFSTDGAGSNRHLRIIANAFGLAHFAARHHIKFIGIFSKPNRSRHLYSVLSERCERDIFLAANWSWNRLRHFHIVAAASNSVVIAGMRRAPLSRLVRAPPWRIDPALVSVLKALHA
jgi:hypothetical protein